MWRIKVCGRTQSNPVTYTPPKGDVVAYINHLNPGFTDIFIDYRAHLVHMLVALRSNTV